MKDVAERAARAAGEVLRRGRARQVRHKGAIDLVTEMDLAAEAAVREVLARETPGVPIFGEEGGGTLRSTCWIVDPLDGTTNFVHGFPAWSVSVAFLEDGHLEAGCVFDPLHDVAYTARRALGAFADGEPIRVSSTLALGEALLITGFPYDSPDRAPFYLSFFEAFLRRSQGVRRTGSAALDLALLASGRADGFWEFGLHAWDVAAGALIVAEAGGLATGMDGTPLVLDLGRIVASNGRLHEALLEVIRHVQEGQAARPRTGATPWDSR
ncbi:MAG: inositol monophosphatase [Deltaproteobacteria bacterium]|nr:inositol monophosphatase [Deltaproteobacteria bacterium]